MTPSQRISIVLLAGGIGSRMQMPTPKQFMLLTGKPLLQHSYEVLAGLPNVYEVVIVCDQPYRDLCQTFATHPSQKFALPGPRRQDSVYNGLLACDPSADLICIHDGARPLLSQKVAQAVIDAAIEIGAAAAAVPTKSTIKEIDSSGLVVRTPPREVLWEVQTPQAVRRDNLHAGFSFARAHELTVTDDVSLVELLGLPAKLVTACYSNIKITTREDLLLAEQLLSDLLNMPAAHG